MPRDREAALARISSSLIPLISDGTIKCICKYCTVAFGEKLWKQYGGSQGLALVTLWYIQATTGACACCRFAEQSSFWTTTANQRAVNLPKIHRKLTGSTRSPRQPPLIGYLRSSTRNLIRPEWISELPREVDVMVVNCSSYSCCFCVFVRFCFAASLLFRGC